MRKLRKSRVGMTRQRELEALIKQAQQQPGIKELLAVHERWSKLEQVAGVQRRLLGMTRIVSLSDNSHTVL